MKKTLLILAAALLTSGELLAQNVSLPIVRARQSSISDAAVPQLPAGIAAKPRRSDEINKDYSNIVATTAQTWYYGEQMGTGTGSYYLFLSTNGLASNGIPTGPGQVLQAYIVTDQPSDGDIVLPTGTYTVASTGTTNYVYGGSISHFIDAFYDTDNTESDELIGYRYELGDGGTVTIAKTTTGDYNITADLSIKLYDENDSVVYTNDDVHISYTGGMTYRDKDPSKYTPFAGKEYSPEFTGVSGRYTNFSGMCGDFTFSFYNVGLDEEGYIVSPGFLLNCELMVEEGAPADPAKLPGTYTIASDYSVNSTMTGMWYKYYGKYFPLGTYCAFYDEDGLIDSLALMTAGTITVTDMGNNEYKFDFDLTSLQGAHFITSFQGKVMDYLTDTGINGVATSTSRKVVGYYTVNGQRLNAPQKGLNIVRYSDGTTEKRMVK